MNNAPGPQNARILIVEDEDKIADVLRDYLRQHGYETHRIARGDEVEDWVRANPVDLVLLDVMLPGLDGMEVCRRLRTFSDAAIIMVTARVDEIDRLLGLGLGADDYICKPFSPREVVARVATVLRRTRRAQQAAGPRNSGLVLDESGWRATLDGHPLDLTAVEFKLLSVLASQPGRIFTRDQLMDHMYRDERVVADRTVDSHVKKLRRKIAEVAPGEEFIHSVYGVGYCYEDRRHSQAT
ncbi:MAG: response regulator [Pseudomonadota bacterium]|jgi:two-component system response regulator BaeR|nr:MAG: two-component system response regulator BaeR [Pseudomonadota bacterium]